CGKSAARCNRSCRTGPRCRDSYPQTVVASEQQAATENALEVVRGGRGELEIEVIEWTRVRVVGFAGKPICQLEVELGLGVVDRLRDPLVEHVIRVGLADLRA